MLPKIIIGLGNIGDAYVNTKHNAGFIILDNFATQQSLTWQHESKLSCMITKANNIILAKPTTFMNKSGTCVAKIMAYYKVEPSEIIVLHDDVDLQPLSYKFKFGSSAAGHHGVLDIIEKLGTQDFWRLRIGVGRPLDTRFDVGDFVLDKLSKDELEYIKNIPFGFWQ